MIKHATEAGWISRSHRAISPFRLARPSSVQQAVDLLNSEDNPSIIAGGIDLVRRMRGGDTWDTLIDISAIEELKTITKYGDYIRIGALVTHWDIETSALLGELLPDFRMAWTTIGNVRVRMAGTIGGNLMSGEAAYDGRVILGVLGAELEFATESGKTRLLSSRSSHIFPAGALLMGVRIPIVSKRNMLFDRSLKPLVSVAVSIDGDCYSIGVGCAFDQPEFHSGTGSIQAGSVSAVLPEPIDNPLGGSSYRRRMVGVLAARAYRLLLGGG